MDRSPGFVQIAEGLGKVGQGLLGLVVLLAFLRRVLEIPGRGLEALLRLAALPLLGLAGLLELCGDVLGGLRKLVEVVVVRGLLLLGGFVCLLLDLLRHGVEFVALGLLELLQKIFDLLGQVGLLVLLGAAHLASQRVLGVLDLGFVLALCRLLKLLGATAHAFHAALPRAKRHLLQGLFFQRVDVEHLLPGGIPRVRVLALSLEFGVQAVSLALQLLDATQGVLQERLPRPCFANVLFRFFLLHPSEVPELLRELSLGLGEASFARLAVLLQELGLTLLEFSRGRLHLLGLADLLFDLRHRRAVEQDQQQGLEVVDDPLSLLVGLRKGTRVQRFADSLHRLQQPAFLQVTQALVQEFDLPRSFLLFVLIPKRGHQVAKPLRLAKDGLLIPLKLRLELFALGFLLRRSERRNGETDTQRADEERLHLSLPPWRFLVRFLTSRCWSNRDRVFVITSWNSFHLSRRVRRALNA